VDVIEKAAQVPRMGEIYKAAARTLVWLDEDPDDGLALSFIEWIETEAKDKDVVAPAALPGDVFEAQVDAYRRLVNRPWFFRVWVTQEIALSQSITVMYGHNSLEWSSLLASMYRAGQLRQLTWNPSKNGKPPNFMGFIAPMMDLLRSEYRDGRHVPVCHLMLCNEDRGCQEPVDRVWALLGMVHEYLRRQIESSNAINYDDENKLQYWRSYLTVMKLIFESWRMDFWSTLTQGVGLTKLSHLPSWCPDWSGSRICRKLGGKFRAGHLDAMARMLPGLSMPAGTDWLSVAGFSMDTVHSSTEPLPLSMELRLDKEVRMQIWAWLLKCCDLAVKGSHSPDRALQALYRTLDAKSGPLDEAQRSSILFRAISCALAFWSGKRDDIDVGMVAVEFHECVNINTFGRRFFNTVDGRVGLGPPDMQTGDQVVVFNGADELYVLRKIDRVNQNSFPRLRDVDLGEDNKFELVGDAWVHGLMQGEAFTAEDRGPDTNFVLV
jgi:hypothetical protein